MSDPALVNQVFGEVLSGYGWLAHKEPAALRKYGAEALGLAKEIYASALDYSVNWHEVTIAEAVAAVRDDLQNTYPFLKPTIAVQISNHFAYAWK